MPKVVVRGESVYQCTICDRKTRVPTNQRGLDVIYHCTITSGCKGKLNRLTLIKDIISTPTLTPSVSGLQDWFQRKVLYTHSQNISSNNWIVPHELNNKPTIHVFTYKSIDGVKQLIPTVPDSITTIDSNKTQISFVRAETGIAQCIALASQNVTNDPTRSTAAITGDKVQYSNNIGVITIATLNDDPTISIMLTFMVSNQDPVTIIYDYITAHTTVSSPWANTSKIYVNGKTYTTRTLDIVNHPSAMPFFLSGQIPPQGCTYYIQYLNSNSVISDEVLMLGANTPYGIVDRVYDSYSDFSSETSTTGGVIYSFGKTYVNPPAIKNAYPYIVVV